MTEQFIESLAAAGGAAPSGSALDRDRGVRLDSKGFVLTGAEIDAHDAGRTRLPLETNIPGVFAIGDVREGSTKRVAAAVGEGAAAVAQLHAHLGGILRREPAPPR